MAILVVALFLSVGVFIALLPMLIDANAVRKTMTKNLAAWNGGEVSIAGPVRIGSFANLSVEASDVVFSSANEGGPVRSATVKSVTASLKLSSLLRGKFDFEKFRLHSPHIVLRRDILEVSQAFYGLRTAQLALVFAGKGPFADIELLDPVFSVSGPGKGAYENVKLNRVRIAKRAVTPVSTGVFVANARAVEDASYEFDVAADAFTASFRGQCSAHCQNAFGSFHLKTAIDPVEGKTLLSALAPWERPDMIDLSGDLNMSKGRAALDDAVISFGDHSANGMIALDLTGARPRLEGTIAYDRLDLTRVMTIGEAGLPSDLSFPAALTLARRGLQQLIDFDLRLSAEHVRAPSFETGPIALAFNANEDRVSIDVASVSIFGGRAGGRLDIDENPAVLSLRVSGAPLDSQALARAMQLPLGLTGQAKIDASLSMPLEKPNGATGTFAIRFPTGCSIEGEAGRALNAALAEADLASQGEDALSFAVARINGTVGPKGVDLKIEGRDNEKVIDGSIAISLPGARIGGTLLASESLEPPDAPAAPAPPKKFVLSGTADALVLSSARQSSLSN